MKKLIKKIVFYIKYYIGIEFADFHYFPFNPLDVRLKDCDAVSMNVLCNLLDNSDIQYRLTDGIALGLYRNQAFIKHDNDIDFDVLEMDNYLQLKSLLKGLGFSIGRLVFWKGKVQQVVFYNENRLIVDFVIWKREGDYIYNYSEKGYERKQNIKYFSPLTRIQCYGHEFKIPGYIEEWLAFRYGNDWNIPKTYKGDWKEECGDIHQI